MTSCRSRWHRSEPIDGKRISLGPAEKPDPEAPFGYNESTVPLLGSLVDQLRSPEMRRKLRYASVSAVFVPIGQVLLQLIVAFGFDGSDSGRDNALANVMVATILSPPYYLASRRFVWGLRSSSQVDEGRRGLLDLAVGGVIASSTTLWLAAILFPTTTRSGVVSGS